jgi:hypothetical protein
MRWNYAHCYLQCPNSHRIPVPYSNPLGTDGSPRRTPTDTRTAVFVCPDCGLASAYSARDILEDRVLDIPGPFLANECHLGAIQLECDGENCKAPKVIHVIQGDAKGTWKPKSIPKDWRFSDSARCAAGHKLRFDLSVPHRVEPSEMPF